MNYEAIRLYRVDEDDKHIGINWNPNDGLPAHNLSVNGTMSIKGLNNNSPIINFLNPNRNSLGTLSFEFLQEDSNIIERVFRVGIINQSTLQWTYYGLPRSKVNSNERAILTTEDLPLSIIDGGTGANTVATARNNLGLGNTSGALPVANGGTGATTEFNAIANLLWKDANDSTYLTGSTTDINNAGTIIGWYDSSSTISIKPSTYGYLLSIGGRGGVNWHQIWMTQANGALYHRGGNNSSTPASVAFKQIIDEAGGILTGQLTATTNNGFLLTTSSGSAMIRATRSDTGTSLGVGVGSGGTNHGVYSYLLNDWLIYATDTETVVKGRCTGTAANVTGTVAVANGGTGQTTLTSGNALIGAGTGAVTTRAITNMTALGYITYNTNLMTTNTLAYWNGAYNTNNASNLTYYRNGTIYGSGQFGWKRQSMNTSSTGSATTTATGVIATSVISAQRVGDYSDNSGSFNCIGAISSNAGNIRVHTAAGSTGGSWTIHLFWTKSASGG